MCEIFFGPWLKYIYIIILCVYCLFASWSFCTVAGSAWASNIPYNFGGIVECADGAFHHTLLPSDPGCLRAYYFSLFLFGVIVVTLSMLDLKEQAVIQIVMGLLRFFTVGAILVYTIVKLTTGDDICEPEVPTSEYTEDSTWTHFYNVSVNATRYTSLQDIVVKFDIKGLLAATPVLTYAFIVHQGIPSLTHPIKQKRSLHWLMMAMFGTGTICYLSLGVVVPLWFKADTQETITLNFVSWYKTHTHMSVHTLHTQMYPHTHTHPTRTTLLCIHAYTHTHTQVEFTKPQNHHPTQLKVLAYYLILFPSLDVMSAFPLMIHVIVNNTYALFRNTILFGIRLITKKNIKSLRFDWVFKLVFRFFTAILPLLLALTMANLIYVLKFAGLFGFFMCFFFPSALQIQSIRVCKKTFGPNSLKIDGVPSLKVPPRVNEKAPLIQNLRRGHFRSFRKTYMTPYSFFILSHPITACVVIVIGVCLFSLTLASWFTAPVKVTCAL